MVFSAKKTKVVYTGVFPVRVYWGKVKIAFGEIYIARSEKGEICLVGFRNSLKEWQKHWPKTKFIKSAQKPPSSSERFLLCGTEFQRSVWKALLDIPPGKTLSYKALAQRIGKPNAARAVGNAVGANPVPIFVPCHRVIAGDGTIGGFSGGIKNKIRLLNAEKITFRKAL